MKVVVNYVARCMVCDWRSAADSKRTDLDAEKHTKASGHATVQEGTRG